MSQRNKTNCVIFTDGASSGNPGPGGWGTLVWIQPSQVEEWGGGDPHTTNNRMELMGVIQGLGKVPTQSHLTIATDSSYVIQGATRWLGGWKSRGWKTLNGTPVANRDLWERLEEALEGARPLSLEWKQVPGHAGVPGNERADEIATRFSKGLGCSFYRGTYEEYGIDLTLFSATEDKKPKKKSKNKGPAFSYVSLVGGRVDFHKTWAECERRVKGVPQAKFKKALSKSDEDEILAAWGVKRRPGSEN